MSADRAIVIAVLDAIDDIEIGLGIRQVSDIERRHIRAHLSLETVDVFARDIEWMTASCPSLRLAQRLYREKRTP